MATKTDAARVLERLEQLYGIGGGQGANRPHASPEEQRAHELAAEWLEGAGLEVEVDPDGNLFGHAKGTVPETGSIWTGSHLDSVPQGGKFDGALGVVAAIEAVERVGRGSVVVFRGEEVGCVGSRARVARGCLPSVFLEVHNEQGPRLAAAGAPLAVVSSIAGIARGELVVEGAPGHAGTTPMDARDDALVKAAELVLQIRAAARAIDGAVATVGTLDVEPGAVNVIPSRVVLGVDARAPDEERFARLIDALGLDPSYRIEPVEMAVDVVAALRTELETRDLPVVELSSGAGHDAGILAAAGVRAGMLFVRSLNGGVSHSPDELCSGDDVALAVDVLTGALARLTV